MHGLKHVNKSSSFLIATFTERKPVPIGVVIGPFNAILFFAIDCNVLSGKGIFPGDEDF